MRRTKILLAGVGLLVAEVALVRQYGIGAVTGLFSGLSAFTGIPYNTLIVLTGSSLLGLASGAVGAFAVLRGRSLLGDAVAHAALPGLCIAFMVVGDRHFGAMLAGAIASGLLGVGLVSWLKNDTKLKADAAIGIVLSVFFAAGTALTRMLQNDPKARMAGLDSYLFGKASSMVSLDVILIMAVALNVLLALSLLKKEFAALCFDPQFTSVCGYPVRLLDMLLMGLLVVTTVIGLPAVGVVLMAGMLIIPGVAARFWTSDLTRMLRLSGAFGFLTGAMGTVASAALADLPAGPVMILSGTGIFAFSMLFAPERGVIARWWRHRQLNRRIADQNLLRAMYELGESAGGPTTVIAASDLLQRRSWGRTELEAILTRAREHRLVERTGINEWRLTELGLAEASEVVRTHRLWELFLVRHAEIAHDHVDRDADEFEHLMPPEILAELEQALELEERWPTPAVPHSVHGLDNATPSQRRTALLNIRALGQRT